MEEIQSWVENGYKTTSIFSNSSPPSSTSSSHETHSAPTLCEDSSFNSLESDSSTQTISHNLINSPITKPSVSHFFIASIKTTAPQISCLAIQNNNLYAATIQEINVFDLTTLFLVETFGSGSGWAKSIAFCGGKIFTAHQDCKIRVWTSSSSSSNKQQKHRLVKTLPTLKNRMFKCMLPKNYVQVRRHSQKLWIQHADAVSGLAMNNNLGLMYSVSWDKSFKTWKTTSDMGCLESVRAHSDAVNAIAVNPVDNTVITGSADGQIKIWAISGDSKKHLLVATLSKHKSSVNVLALTPDGSTLCSGGGDHVINVWKKTENENHFEFFCCLKGHKGAILCLVHVNGLLISGSSDRKVRIWKHGKESEGVCLAAMEGHSKAVKSLVTIPGGDLDHVLTVYSGSLEGEIRAWKVCFSLNESLF